MVLASLEEKSRYVLLTEWDNIGEMAQKSFSAKFYHHAHKLVFVTIFT